MPDPTITPIVERLRVEADMIRKYSRFPDGAALLEEAADEIERILEAVVPLADVDLWRETATAALSEVERLKERAAEAEKTLTGFLATTATMRAEIERLKAPDDVDVVDRVARAIDPNAERSDRTASIGAVDAARRSASAALSVLRPGDRLPGSLTVVPAGAYRLGDRVRKFSGAYWEGRVCGFYSTKQTPIGYCVQLDTVPMGPVQIYPEQALVSASQPGGEG